MSEQHIIIEHLSAKDLTRIFSNIKVDPAIQFNSSPCWAWTAACMRTGYGRISLYNKQFLVHRLMYAWLVGPLPHGKRQGEIDHLCRNRACCNPIHLELVSSRVNVLRGMGPSALGARKTHCPKGHPYAGDNLIIHPNNPTRRWCRECHRVAAYIRYHSRKKLANT